MADKGSSNRIMGFILVSDGISMVLVAALADVIRLGRAPGFGILQMGGALWGVSLVMIGQFVVCRLRTRVRFLGITLVVVGIVFLGLIYTARIFGFALIIQQTGIYAAAAVLVLAESLVHKWSIGRLMRHLLLTTMAAMSKFLQILFLCGRLTKFFLVNSMSKILQLLSSSGRLARYFLLGAMGKILQLLSSCARLTRFLLVGTMSKILQLWRQLTFPGSPKRYFITIRFFAITVIILWLLVPNVVRLGKGAARSIYSISKNWSRSYEEKMRSYWGGIYTYFEFVNERSPSSAIIMYPPQQNPWLTIGNGGLIQYFVQPRRIAAPNRKRIESDKTITHILIAWGHWNPPDPRMYGWPKFPVNMRKFYYLPRKRKLFVDSLLVASSLAKVSSKAYPENSGHSSELLENYISDADKEVNDHQLVMSDDHLVEYLEQTYTSSNFDYWMRVLDIPLDNRMVIEARIKASSKHSVNLVAEVRYDNGKSTIFGSVPNKETDSWESLLIDDLYERAKSYALSTGWDAKAMWLTRIGINTGHPFAMPYLEGYGVIELERGQESRKIDSEVNCAPKFISLGNLYRAKGQIEEAIAEYQLAEILEPTNPWIYSYLGDMLKKKGDKKGAITEYKRAIELDPHTAWFYFALGEVYREEGEIDLAVESFEKAVELDPDNIWAHNILGEIYMERKKGKEARTHLVAGARLYGSAGSLYATKELKKISSTGKDYLQGVTENPTKENCYRLWKDYYGFFGLPVTNIKRDGIFEVRSLKMRFVGYRGVKIGEKGRTIYPQQYDKSGKVVFVIDVPDELIELVIKPDLAVVHKGNYARIYLSKDGVDYKLVYDQNGVAPKTYSSSEIDATQFAKSSQKLFLKIELFVDGTTSTSLKGSRIGGNFQVWTVSI